jgi:hypothetical protein
MTSALEGRNQTARIYRSGASCHGSSSTVNRSPRKVFSSHGVDCEPARISHAPACTCQRKELYLFRSQVQTLSPAMRGILTP